MWERTVIHLTLSNLNPLDVRSLLASSTSYSPKGGSHHSIVHFVRNRRKISYFFELFGSLITVVKSGHSVGDDQDRHDLVKQKNVKKCFQGTFMHGFGQLTPKIATAITGALKIVQTSKTGLSGQATG